MKTMDKILRLRTVLAEANKTHVQARVRINFLLKKTYLFQEDLADLEQSRSEAKKANARYRYCKKQLAAIRAWMLSTEEVAN
jgi:hypothetical protein